MSDSQQTQFSGSRRIDRATTGATAMNDTSRTPLGMLKELATSKKFVVAILGVFIPPINVWMGWDLTIEMLAPVTAYILGQGAADFGKARR